MKLKKTGKTIIALLIVAISANFINVSAAEMDEMNENKVIQQLLKTATSTEYNIMLYDEEDKIINEFHVDGESITYSYDNKSINKVESSNGNSVEFILENNKREVNILKNQIKVNSITLDNDFDKKINDETISIEERTKLLEEVANTGIHVNNQNFTVFRLPADTITNGYNLSTMCPSVWSVAMGTDKFVRSSTSMDKNAIQNFLTAKNSILKNDIKIYKKDSSGNVYYTGQTINPATAIDTASRNYGINPKIILGSLQREQSLISMTSGDVSTRAFYFCMGYGATDGGDYNGYSGFDTQISGGTNLYASLWYEGYQFGQNGFSVTFSASDGSVQVNNCGTYALYRYTPWKSSNLLFLQILKGYWPQTSGANGINWD